VIEKTVKHRGRKVKVTFSIPVEWLDRPVSVVGDFNDWDPGAKALRKKGAVRTASVDLEPGRRYRFRYLDADGRWHDDPAADDVVPNEAGGTDCVIDLTEPDDGKDLE
jgi:1,4-alpha-glucan branching enzyme